MTDECRTMKQGRPTMDPKKRKLASVGFRPTPKLRSQLETAAAEDGRSMSQEIVSRLEASFIREESRP